MQIKTSISRLFISILTSLIRFWLLMTARMCIDDILQCWQHPNVTMLSTLRNQRHGCCNLRCARTRLPRRYGQRNCAEQNSSLLPKQHGNKSCGTMQSLPARALPVSTFHAAKPTNTRTRRVAVRCTRPICAAAVGKHFVVVWGWAQHRLAENLLNFRPVYYHSRRATV